MKSLITTAILVLTIDTCRCDEQTVSGPDKEKGFVAIFDGKSLKDWEVMPAEEADSWSVQNGCIVGKGGPQRSYLVYRNRNVSDFELRLQYRFPQRGNSGVSIRAVVDETRKRAFKSYHADLGHVGIGRNVLGAWDFHTPGRKEHRCFRGDRLVIEPDDSANITPIPNALTAADVNQGDWNDVRIVAKKNKFSLSINGKLSSEFTELLPSRQRLKSGMIQLQLHDPGMEVQFRSVRICIHK